MINLACIGHVLLRVADEERSRRFYCDVLGFRVAEADPEHGGVFMTLDNGFHTIDVVRHPSPESAAQPLPGQFGLVHIAFKVASYAALRDAYAHLQQHGVALARAMDHVSQRSLYFTDPDGNGLEIYYERPDALTAFPDGRGDQDERLPLTAPGEPLPGWLNETWPAAARSAAAD
ncbi:MAG TPA: VOC family protein [Stellaceae bacterium]|nr:VOC family protein [Stellaceae bacterium]